MAITGLPGFILYCIEVHGAFAYPELGTLKTERLPAKYTIDRKSILPPSTQVNFSPIYEPKYDLKYLGKNAGIEAMLLGSWISELEEFVSRQSTEKDLTLHLKGLGTFTRTNGETKFITLEKTDYLYPILSIQPLPIPFHSIEFAVENPKKLIIPGREKQKSTGYLIFPIIIIAIVALIICLRSCSNVPGEEKTIPPIVQNDTNDGKTNEDTIEETTNPVYDSTAIISTSTDSVIKDSDTIKVQTKPQTTSIKPDVSQERFCIYVVGAFQKKNNAVQLSKKLKKEGLRAKIYPAGKFYRVGISLTCIADSSGQLSKLQTRFPDIWVLE